MVIMGDAVATEVISSEFIESGRAGRRNALPGVIMEKDEVEAIARKLGDMAVGEV